MNDIDIEEFEFTDKAWDDFYKLVGSPDFQGKEGQAVYEILVNSFPKVDFSDYIKRFLHKKLGFQGEYGSTPFNEYRDTLVMMFKDNKVPSSFDSATVKLSVMVKSCLSKPCVSRKTVMLLGFALNMSVDEVNELLTKGIFEQKLNPKDPLEVICKYCFKNRLDYYDFERLMFKYRSITASNKASCEESTGQLEQKFCDIKSEKSLMNYLAEIKDCCGISKYSRTSRKMFINLYNRVCDIIMKNCKETGDDDKKRITANDVERVIYAGVPKDNKNRNLYGESMSTLYKIFYGERLSRHRIGRILGNNNQEKERLQEIEVSRYDLITLNFYIFSQTFDVFSSARERFYAFYTDTNRILTECFMHEMIVQNPYENFIMCCMLFDDPLDVFESVWEKSYQ